METLEIKKTDALKAYNSGGDTVKELLRTLFGEKIFSQKITDRVKTFQDALNVLGDQPVNTNILLDYNGVDADMIAAQAFMKLTLICRALNEGWKPDWTNSNEYKYYPWFDIRSGSGLAYYDFDYWSADSYVGSRLCFKSRELAEYAGKQFISIYTDLFILK